MVLTAFVSSLTGFMYSERVDRHVSVKLERDRCSLYLSFFIAVYVHEKVRCERIWQKKFGSMINS